MRKMMGVQDQPKFNKGHVCWLGFIARFLKVMWSPRDVNFVMLKRVMKIWTILSRFQSRHREGTCTLRLEIILDIAYRNSIMLYSTIQCPITIIPRSQSGIWWLELLLGVIALLMPSSPSHGNFSQIGIRYLIVRTIMECYCNIGSYCTQAMRYLLLLPKIQDCWCTSRVSQSWIVQFADSCSTGTDVVALGTV